VDDAIGDAAAERDRRDSGVRYGRRCVAYDAPAEGWWKGEVARGNGVTRRTVLSWSALGWSALAGVVGLSGCTYDPRPPEPPPDPDTVLRDRIVADKRALLASYDATARRHPGLGKRLAPLRADHAAHMAALGAPEPTSTGPATPGPATPTGSAPGAGATAPAVPAAPRAAVRALVAAEAAAAALRVRDCVAANSPDLARLLAAIGGCEAAHAALLRGGSA